MRLTISIPDSQTNEIRTFIHLRPESILENTASNLISDGYESGDYLNTEFEVLKSVENWIKVFDLHATHSFLESLSETVPGLFLYYDDVNDAVSVSVAGMVEGVTRDLVPGITMKIGTFDIRQFRIDDETHILSAIVVEVQQVLSYIF